MFKKIVNGEATFLPLTTKLGENTLDSLLTTNKHRFKTILVEGRELLDYEHLTTDVDGRHGSYFQGSKAEPRVITITVHLSAVDAPNLLKLYMELNKVLKKQKEEKLSFSDDEESFFNAVFVKHQTEHSSKNEAIIKLEFRCYDPMKYTTSKHSLSHVIDYAGYEDVKPVIFLTLQGEGTELRLLHIEKQLYVRLTGHFQNGDIVTFDMKKRTITQNDRDVLKNLDMVNSRFFSLSPGVNTLDSSITAGYRTEYREVYR